MNLKFSVITVVYNAESVIQKTMDSVLNQEESPFEYIIIDGFSSDNTLKIIRSYETAFEKKGIRFVLISEKDTGIYNAMNKGIDIAEGDFISFLNAGDWYELDALKNINKFYQEEAFELTYGGLHYINPNGSVINKMSKMDKFWISSRNWNHPSMFLKREIYQKYKFDELIRTYADFDLYLKLRKINIKIRVIDKIIANFVADGVSTNVNLEKVLLRAKEKYNSYRNNKYSRLYFVEAYGWEICKALYFKIRS